MDRTSQIETNFGSDLERDGAFLELDVVTEQERRTVAEIFFSDRARKFTFAAYEPFELPLEKLEDFVQTARSRLRGVRPAT